MPDGTVEDDWGPGATSGRAVWDLIGVWRSADEASRRDENTKAVAKLAILAGAGGGAIGVSAGWGILGAASMAVLFLLGFIAAIYWFWPDQTRGKTGASIMFLPPAASGDALTRERVAASARKIGLEVAYETKSFTGLVWSMDAPISVYLQHGAKGKPNRLLVRGRGGVTVKSAFAALKGQLLVSFTDPMDRRSAADEEE